MPANDLAIVVLAAGKGTRLKSSLAKVLHRAGGRPLVEQVLRACAPLGAKRTVVVVGHQAEQVTAVIEPLEAASVLQHPQHGTGHAMQIARRALGNSKLAIVLPGDAPLIRTGTLRAMVAAHRAASAAATVLSAVVNDPRGYGRIVRKSETQVGAIAEESQLTEEQRDINEINSSIYCFSLDKLWAALAQVKPNNKHREI
jgi:bifunctional N-acetylglucosamine-1-phosphate-uridyltransferase/glucosamine-1-phosphate-acetyltransferase GlmU-like protein